MKEMVSLIRMVWEDMRCWDDIDSEILKKNHREEIKILPQDFCFDKYDFINRNKQNILINFSIIWFDWSPDEFCKW